MKPKSFISKVFLSIALVTGFGLPFIIAGQSTGDRQSRDFDSVIKRNARELVEQGRQIFRFDTFGDEEFWGDTLKLHRAIAGSRFGGVGPGINPLTALAVGLKVDSEALPANLVESIRKGRVDLTDPATTLALLRLNSVVGVTGFFNPQGTIQSIGTLRGDFRRTGQTECGRDQRRGRLSIIAKGFAIEEKFGVKLSRSPAAEDASNRRLIDT